MPVGVPKLLMPAAGLAAAVARGAASLPPVIAESGGLWEVSHNATGTGAEKSCVPQAVVLAQWEHRRAQCARVVISSTTTEAVIHYTCPGGDFAHSMVKVITPRTL